MADSKEEQKKAEAAPAPPKPSAPIPPKGATAQQIDETHLGAQADPPSPTDAVNDRNRTSVTVNVAPQFRQGDTTNEKDTKPYKVKAGCVHWTSDGAKGADEIVMLNARQAKAFADKFDPA